MDELAWWQRGAIYQIYPRSFADSNGDGVGDLRGIAARLDHLTDLAVEAIWLSPFFKSPMADFGYDVSDYRDVDPIFGTLADFDHLVAECHARGIRVVIDWVPNHTSHRHPWFEASRSSRDDPKRDWYVWRDGDGDGPPNDWRSQFNAVGPSWTFDEATGQWYLHSFMAEQPDLDWGNPEVEAAMHDVIRFWLDRGVDGLRLDAIHKIAKDPLLRDHAGAPRRHDEDWETIHERLRGIRRVVDEYDDRMIVGEVALQDLHRIVGYLESGDQLHLAHNFVFVDLPWDAEAFRTSIDDFEALADRTAWPAWFLENHDHPRLTSRFGAGPARAAAVILYALRGTPFVYQGQELGLPDAAIPPDRVVDVDGRDPERAPIPWEPGPGAGFTDGEPWLPVDDSLNAVAQASDPRSALSLFQRLAALRRELPALQSGTQRTVEAGPDVLAWLRDEQILVAVNFSAEPRPLEARGTLLLSSDPDGTGEELAPYEAVIVRLDD
jgi:alpha-glucosidase